MLVHEKQVNEKIKKHNNDTAEFLRSQMNDKVEVKREQFVGEFEIFLFMKLIKGQI